MLAAGGGTRLGGGKLLLPWRGSPLIAHLARTVNRAFGLHSLTVVLGHDADAVRDATARSMPTPTLPVRFVHNRNWSEGLSTSLRHGLESVLAAPDSERIGGVLFLLADQPLVSVKTLNALVLAHGEACARNPDHPATAPMCRGRRGNPVILGRRLFPAVMTLEGDIGARRILEDLGDELLRLPVDDPGILHDVDTPQAYEALCDAIADAETPAEIAPEGISQSKKN